MPFEHIFEGCKKYEEILALEEEHSTVFRDDVPSELPSERPVDHHIETLSDSQPPNCGIFQLSPAELMATKQYMMDVLRKEKSFGARIRKELHSLLLTQKGSSEALLVEKHPKH